MTASIEWRPDDRQLHLRSERLSYVVGVLEDGSLGHRYLGAPLGGDRSYRHLGPGEFRGFANRVGAPVALEYPVTGTGDFRIPALAATTADGSSVLQLAYAGHEIRRGKPGLDGLPATYVESEHEAATVDVLLRDDPSGLELRLRYTIFSEVAAVTRSVRVRNAGSAAIRLETVMSASLDLPDADWTLVHLSGAWARERHPVVRRLAPGNQSVSSRRGASSHQHNPFLALARPSSTEEHGDVLGVSLVYSGNFLAEVEVDSFDTARLRVGIEPETFSWLLEPGAEFQAPEAVMAWSGTGFGGLSDTYHSLFRGRLARGSWRDRPRPVLINNWEATYFGFDEPKLLEIANAARDLGMELLVLDDGWFGKRDDDTTSLGDWFVDRRKLPDGVDGLARKVEAIGLRFGLWIEPEMISERSRLFEEHPEWAIGVPGRPRTPSRQQFVLDLSRTEVVDHVFGVLSEVLGSAPISYVKWDMNRNITEPWSPSLPPDRQGEFFHRYILGVYDLYRRLTTAFPEILFESCAGGGGRFDPGILAFAPQGWTSDDTDAVERLRIQWGTSIVYPQSSMGAHVSAVPNHQVGRVTSLSARAAVAFFGAFGYELDPTSFTDDERREVAEQVAFYKGWRDLFQFGRFVRLQSPFEGDGNETAWMVVADGARTAIVAHYRVLNRPTGRAGWLRLRGLDPSRTYRVSSWPEPAPTPIRRGGDDLMGAGLALAAPSAADGDFTARVFVLESEEA
jgi:alpha-galactosidase